MLTSLAGIALTSRAGIHAYGVTTVHLVVQALPMTPCDCHMCPVVCKAAMQVCVSPSLNVSDRGGGGGGGCVGKACGRCRAPGSIRRACWTDGDAMGRKQW